MDTNTIIHRNQIKVILVSTLQLLLHSLFSLSLSISLSLTLVLTTHSSQLFHHIRYYYLRL